ncbi:hypothetical protein BH23ACT2_BH23ACT2_04740 [soil metagenome]
MTIASGEAGTRRIRPCGRTAVLLGLVVVLAFVIRIDLLRNTAAPIPPAPAVSDAAAYRLLGQGIADGEGYVRPFDRQRDGVRIATAEYPPGYPLLLAAAATVGITDETGQRILLCGVGALTVGLIGLVARRLGGDGAGLIAAGVAALHPALWSTDTSPLAEPLAACLGTGVVLVALAVYDRPRPERWLLLGALAGLGGLVRTELLLMGVLLVVPLALQRVPGRRARLVAVALGLGAMGAVLAPWTIRNWVTFERIVPVSNNAGSVARGANCDRAYQGEFRALWVTNVADVGGEEVDPDGQCFTGFDVTAERNEAEAAGELRDAGLAYAREHAGELPGVAAARVGRTVGLYRFDQQVNFASFEGRTARWDRWGTRLFQALALVGAAGAVAPWRGRGGPRWVLAVPLVAVLVTVISTYGNYRFRAVADPAVVVLAALAVVDAAARMAPRRAGSMTERQVRPD